MRCRLVKNFPVSKKWLQHLYLDGLLLGILHSKLITAFILCIKVTKASRLFKGGLLLFSGNIKGIAQMQLQRFLFWSVVNAIFSHKLQ